LTDWLLALIASEPDLTLDAIAKRLFAAHEMKTSVSSVDRFYARHKISFKKKPARQRTTTARRSRGSRKLEDGATKS